MSFKIAYLSIILLTITLTLISLLVSFGKTPSQSPTTQITEEHSLATQGSKPNLNPTLPPQSKEINFFYEKIPMSKFHSPDATWWGYNQTKIARFGDYVFMYVINNQDNDNKTLSSLQIYKKYKDNAWEKGASFPTSRPGNILLDSNGGLHTFVFEPTDVATNDSIGSLKHYYFPNAKSGDITNYQTEVVIEGDGSNETVNIRVGAAISRDDVMTLGFGLTTFNPLYQGHSEHLYFKKPTDSSWNHLIAGENLGHDFFYPFVLSSGTSFYLLPVQDDFAGLGNPNIYQKIMLLEYVNNTWRKEIITDLTAHQLASTRPRLLEQSELFEDQKGKLHIIYKEFLDPSSPYPVSSFKHLVRDGERWKTDLVDTDGKNIQWVRLIDIGVRLYYLISTPNSLFLKSLGSGKIMELDLPNQVQSIYPYLSSPKTGTKDSEPYIDILAITADKNEYSSSASFYLRIPKSEFSKLD
ncbi:MAG: hypothetical protein A2802_01005 [Candidatus Woykebacteria bacterium RIFCSPHIGHO2_01_FULL_43_29]|uniref:Uncharacterized protein n=2 Tax=Candidatus Woykeibacteriota TaxID=1817899 RepID=A0A1G1WUC4_9BACT|nr:MAG: hypothetical protein A2802_01005 [Candidatus Woykebacteria bacterium RIFCSPHIGHO2_01_FULL_43_29]OGY28993.1 MAG: hypothetical protein A3J50_03840 [Candidatus Woykebacteria bacterium RIFCSPHIGHO2_02_FULL_43_16b]OGY31315.1 MAG: hypothetical protein A3A61_02900 [Candidatus Woykebacteria bacterium RIFCSPLOWO2_01_FULL_43_14]